MKSILVILPYFGRLPKIYQVWKASALDNATIDFLVITDDKTAVTENNVRVCYACFEECKKRIQSLFDFKINLNAPYKLCDYGPCYGLAFADYIANYDFWGFGDLDLVYGNIRSFVTDDILDKYWIISGWGHLTLYKNTCYCNNFFKTKRDGYLYYKNVYQSSKNYVFDEYLHKGIADLWKAVHPDKVWDGKLMDDIIIPWAHFNFVSYHHPDEYLYLIFEYDKGNLYRVFERNGIITKEPTFYAHFQQRKFMKVKTDNFSHFLIIPNSFMDISDISLSGLRRGGEEKKLQHLLYKMKKRIRKEIAKFKFR